MSERNTEIIKRTFQKEVMNPQSNLHMFAGDFDLVQLGFFNIETGEISPHKPITILNGQQILNSMMKGVYNESIPTKQTPFRETVQQDRAERTPKK